MTTQAATLTAPDGDAFYFVTDDGNTWFEVTAVPGQSSDLDHLRPLGGPRPGGLLRMNYATRFLRMQATRPGWALTIEDVR